MCASSFNLHMALDSDSAELSCFFLQDSRHLIKASCEFVHGLNRFQSIDLNFGYNSYI